MLCKAAVRILTRTDLFLDLAIVGRVIRGSLGAIDQNTTEVLQAGSANSNEAFFPVSTRALADWRGVGAVVVAGGFKCSCHAVLLSSPDGALHAYESSQNPTALL